MEKNVNSLVKKLGHAILHSSVNRLISSSPVKSTILCPIHSEFGFMADREKVLHISSTCVHDAAYGCESGKPDGCCLLLS